MVVVDVDRFATGPNVVETAVAALSATVRVLGASAGDTVIANFQLIVGAAPACLNVVVVVVVVVVAIVVVVVVVVAEDTVVMVVDDGDDHADDNVVPSCLVWPALVDTNAGILPADAGLLFCRLLVRAVVVVLFAEEPCGPSSLLVLSVTRDR